MRADYSNGYYYVSNDTGVLRVEADEFERFVHNFSVASKLNKNMGIQGCRVEDRPTTIKAVGKPTEIFVNFSMN